jgi:hypothetical protein
MRDTLEEIRSAGRLALRPVTSSESNPEPVATHTESAPHEVNGDQPIERDSTIAQAAADVSA